MKCVRFVYSPQSIVKECINVDLIVIHRQLFIYRVCRVVCMLASIVFPILQVFPVRIIETNENKLI